MVWIIFHRKTFESEKRFHARIFLRFLRVGVHLWMLRLEMWSVPAVSASRNCDVYCIFLENFAYKSASCRQNQSMTLPLNHARTHNMNFLKSLCQTELKETEMWQYPTILKDWISFWQQTIVLLELAAKGWTNFTDIISPCPSR